MSVQDAINEFEKGSGHGWWPHIKRKEVAQGLRARVNDPGSIDQGNTSLCGPASFLFCGLRAYPEDYVQYIMDLYEQGSAKLWGLHIETSLAIRDIYIPRYEFSPNAYNPATGGAGNVVKTIEPVDWIGLASLRDSENSFLSYSGTDDPAAGITIPSTLAQWFETAGYEVKKNTNVVKPKSATDLELARHLFAQDYNVCLLINSRVLRDVRDADGVFDRWPLTAHWVVLTGLPFINVDKVNLGVFTWGDGKRRVPKYREMAIAEFLSYFHGFVAAK